MEKVLFVCLGNICRSPMAEAVLRHKVMQANLAEKITIASAATSSWEAGKPPHSGTVQKLQEHQVTSEGLFATQITEDDFYEFDWIIGMDQQNILDLKKRAPKQTQHKIHLFMELLVPEQPLDVPDPYYTGDFEETYQLVDRGTDAWLQFLCETKRLKG